MALPFVLGLAVGAGVVCTYKNSDKIKKAISSTFNKTKENVEEIKDTVIATKDCIKSKKEEKEKIEDIKNI